MQKAISNAVRVFPVAVKAKSAGATRTIYKTIKSLTPKQQGAGETLQDAEGRACFDEAEELDARALARKSIVAAEEQKETVAHNMENRLRQTQAFSTQQTSEKQVCKLMAGLPNNQGGPNTRHGRDRNWKDAPAELWKLVAPECRELVELCTDVAQHGRHHRLAQTER